MTLKGREATWRALLAISAVSIPFSCILIVFESLFVGITFAAPSLPQVCRAGGGIWAGAVGAICSTLLMTVVCRRKEEFSDVHTIALCISLCVLSTATDCALIVLEWLCLANDFRTNSPLPVFQLTAGTGHMLCSILMILLFYIYWKLSLLAEKGKETSKLSPMGQRRVIMIPNILQPYPSFVSVDLSK